jgi:hypothetical protein
MRNDLQVLPLTPTLGAEIAGTAETLAAWEPNRTPPDRLRAENLYAATTVECGTCGTLFRPARKMRHSVRLNAGLPHIGWQRKDKF